MRPSTLHLHLTVLILLGSPHFCFDFPNFITCSHDDTSTVIEDARREGSVVQRTRPHGPAPSPRRSPVAWVYDTSSLLVHPCACMYVSFMAPWIMLMCCSHHVLLAVHVLFNIPDCLYKHTHTYTHRAYKSSVGTWIRHQQHVRHQRGRDETTERYNGTTAYKQHIHLQDDACSFYL